MNDLCVRTRFKGSSFFSLLHLYKICGWAFKIKMTMEKRIDEILSKSREDVKKFTLTSRDDVMLLCVAALQMSNTN